jgi:hypothetical protein
LNVLNSEALGEGVGEFFGQFLSKQKGQRGFASRSLCRKTGHSPEHDFHLVVLSLPSGQKLVLGLEIERKGNKIKSKNPQHLRYC